MATLNEKLPVPGQGAGNNLVVGNALQYLDQMANATQDFSLASGDATVNDTETTSNTAHYGKWRTTGTLTANRELIAPSRKWRRWIENACSGAYTVKVVLVAAGAGVEVSAGTTVLLECDGTAITQIAVGSTTNPLALADITEPSPSTNKLYSVATGVLKWAGKRIALIASTLSNSQVVETDSSGYLVSAAKGTAYNKAFGTGSGDVCEGNDSRLSDSRTPSAHASSHENGGADEIALDASQVTTGVFNIARLATGTPDGTKFIRDDGSLVTPSGGSGTLDGLSDVVITSPTTGQVVKYNGTNWVNDADATGGGSGVTSVSGTAPIVSSGGTTPAISISAATTSDAGSMSASDKTKLDGATDAATASKLMIRDASGRVKVADGSASGDCVNKGQLDLKAPLASPTFTGTVTVPTPSNSTDAATKGYVDGIGIGGYDYIQLRDEKSSGTNGGTFTSGSWQTRTLNTETQDTGNDCSLSSNQFTLGAGTYEVEAWAGGNKVSAHQLRIQNITDGTTVIVGQTILASDANGVFNTASLRGRFTIASSKAFELQHRCGTTRSTNGFGSASSWGTEVYAEVVLRKVA
jgi:hypothetical protein